MHEKRITKLYYEIVLHQKNNKMLYNRLKFIIINDYSWHIVNIPVNGCINYTIIM